MIPTGSGFDSPGPSFLTDINGNFPHNSTALIQVNLQYGSLKDVVVVERTDDPTAYSIFVQKARQLIHDAVNPSSNSSMSTPSIAEIQLFAHDYHSSTLLRPVTSLAQLDNGAVVEVIRIDHEERPTRPHMLQINNYRSPTFCDHCSIILVGLYKQGVQCQLCKCNFHKSCAFVPWNNCAKNENDLPQFAVPHTLGVHTYSTPTKCKVCKLLLMGLFRQGLKCRDCEVNVHKKCARQLPMNCQMRESPTTPNFDRMSMADVQSLISAATDNEAIGGKVVSSPSVESESLIPLGRLPGQASTRIDRSPGPMAEGWMIHFVLTEPAHRLRHYWLLKDGAISMYNECSDAGSVNPNRCCRSIPLSTILAIVPYDGPPLDVRFPAHCFEIRTTADITFCVGENLDAFVTSPSTKLPQYGSPHATANVEAWVSVLQAALRPPVLRTDGANSEPALQFSKLYQVLRDKFLGSGQFGTVYSSVHRQSGREVAVKMIAKDRVLKKSSAGVKTLKSEVAILQNIDHYGILKVESTFETKDKIFVVMEKMNGDMLEMILSQATGKLNERSTKFLILQILAALKYLHSHGIVHCDLKPENVLLSSLESPFPHTKLCDFGYARFVGEAQFRKTIVRMPAYWAPEVLQMKGVYNESVDVWAMGIIIYVSLSGTFPFNDGEEISEQIQTAAFMFPPEVWKGISVEAIDLIQKLLRVQAEERLTIGETLAHIWLQDPHVYVDLRQLELRLGTGRYLTSLGQDQIYASCLQQRGVQPYS